MNSIFHHLSFHLTTRPDFVAINTISLLALDASIWNILCIEVYNLYSNEALVKVAMHISHQFQMHLHTFYSNTLIIRQNSTRAYCSEESFSFLPLDIPEKVVKIFHFVIFSNRVHRICIQWSSFPTKNYIRIMYQQKTLTN